MNHHQIEEVVQGYLKQALAGAEMENPKLDFKREWYKLNTDEGKQEFIADTSAIANTFGLDGYIIIGHDEKTKSFTNSPFSESGLRDTSDIMNLISKSVDPIYTLHHFAMEYEGNQLSVLHIPPSIAKPHVIRCYKKNNREEQHRIFVRKGTGKQVANRNDIELMYYDRKNIIPDYELTGSFHLGSFQVSSSKFTTEVRYEITVPLVLENTGRRPVSIVKVRFGASISDNPTPETILYLVGEFIVEPVIIKHGEISTLHIDHRIVHPINQSSLDADLARMLRLHSPLLVATRDVATTTTGQILNFEVEVGRG